MTEFSEVAPFELQVSAIKRLIAEAFEKAPRRSEGTDDAASVRVVLGGNGLPERIQVVADWRNRVAPEKIGDAVVDAFRAAVHKRVVTWAVALEETGWQNKANRLQQYLNDDNISMPRGRLPAAFKREPAEIVPRTLEDVAEGFIKAADRISKTPLRVKVRRQNIGWGAAKKIRLILDDDGIKSCTIDCEWASARTAAELSEGLSKALAVARLSLAKNLKDNAPNVGLEDLLGSALELFVNPHRFTE
ncbi:hypothetical protein GCM10023196_031440 [Actinoallomurus vinaceus]|uniref:Uncharacterized protein n=2 Tax=Actinoallomurus vinaceus TaxID=1080074 RepID=A0ABP8U962_9ACTN